MIQRDEVDGVVSAWEQQRPDIDAAPLEVFSRLIRINRQFLKIRRTIAKKHGLENWEFEMLAALRRAQGHTLTAGQLMKDTFVSSGTITNRIDRMQERGLVRREASASDGRVVHVLATAKGVEVVDQAMTELLGVEQVLLRPFSEAENSAAADYLRDLNSSLAQYG